MAVFNSPRILYFATLSRAQNTLGAVGGRWMGSSLHRPLLSSMRQEPGGPPSWLGCGAALTGGAALLSLFMLLHAEKADHSLALPWPLVLAPLLALPAGALLLIATRAASRPHRPDSAGSSDAAPAALAAASCLALGLLLSARLTAAEAGQPPPQPRSWSLAATPLLLALLLKARAALSGGGGGGGAA